jgi:hypothetical protein
MNEIPKIVVQQCDEGGAKRNDRREPGEKEDAGEKYDLHEKHLLSRECQTRFLSRWVVLVVEVLVVCAVVQHGVVVVLSWKQHIFPK